MDTENAYYTKDPQKEEKKQFPYRYPSFGTRQKNKATTVINFGSLVLTLTTLYFYYRSTFVTHDIKKKAFAILLVSEILPRAVETRQIYKYTKSNFNFWDMLGTFLCGGNYYYWLGSERKQLKKKQLDNLGFIMFAMRFVQIILICYVLGIQYKMNQQTQQNLNQKKITNKIARTGVTLVYLMMISAAWYCIRFIMFLVKKTLRALYGDDFCR